MSCVGWIGSIIVFVFAFGLGLLSLLLPSKFKSRGESANSFVSPFQLHSKNSTKQGINNHSDCLCTREGEEGWFVIKSMDRFTRTVYNSVARLQLY